MFRNVCLSLTLLAILAVPCRAVIICYIEDKIDDDSLVRAVSGQADVKAFHAEMEELEEALDRFQGSNEKLFGPKRAKPENLALLVAQNRLYSYSGLHVLGEDNSHIDYYPIGDFAGIEFRYGIQGFRVATIIYLNTDATFPKLVEVEDKRPPIKTNIVVRKNNIDKAHWDTMPEDLTKEQAAKFFGGPPGEYAPGTEYLTDSWGWHRGRGSDATETLEWCGDKAKIVVEFDAAGKYTKSELFPAGRDPATNITERLAWERKRFDYVKRYIMTRMAPSR